MARHHDLFQQALDRCELAAAFLHAGDPRRAADMLEAAAVVLRHAADARDAFAAALSAPRIPQWGAFVPWPAHEADRKHPAVHAFPDNELMLRVGKHEAGRELDGRTHDAMPEAR